MNSPPANDHRLLARLALAAAVACVQVAGGRRAGADEQDYWLIEPLGTANEATQTSSETAAAADVPPAEPDSAGWETVPPHRPQQLPNTDRPAPVESGPGCCDPTNEPHRRGPFSWLMGKRTSSGRAASAAIGAPCNVHPEPPFGVANQATMHAQIARGEAARMVLYRYDFEPGQAQLTSRGMRQLQKIAELLPRNPFPLLIQPSGQGATLDQKRHATVLGMLAGMPFPVPDQRVVIAHPSTRGLDGLDAELIHENLLQLTSGGSGGATPAMPQIGSGGGAAAPR